MEVSAATISRTGAELGTTPLLGVVCLAMDITDDSLWAGDCASNRVVRIDVNSGEVVAAIDPGFGSLPEESSIAATADAVYVMSSPFTGQVARIDSATNEVAGTFAAPSLAAAVRDGFDSLWFTVPGSGELVQVDPYDGTEISRADVGSGARFLAVGSDSVWVLAADVATVTRVSPTGEVLARVRVGDSPVTGGDIAVGGGSVWARVSDSTVVRIDETSGEIVARYGEPSGSGSVGADNDAAWISAHDHDTVWRLPLS